MADPQMTPERRAKIALLASDFTYYAPRCLKIKDKAGVIKPFMMNRAQQYLHEKVEEQRRRTGKVRVLNLKGRQQGMCLDPDTVVLTADLRWIPLKNVTIGMELVATDESEHRGLGHGNGSRKMRTANVVAIWNARQPSYRIGFDDGRSVICSGDHRWLARKSQKHPSWRSITGHKDLRSGLRAGDMIRSVVSPWGATTMDDAWFGGIIDGEGSFDFKKRSGVDLSVSQCAGAVLDRMIAHCNVRQYKYCVVSDDGPRKTKFGLRPVHAISISNIPDVLMLVGQARPVRLIGQRWWEGKRTPENGWRTILSIDLVGERELIDIQTSTGTFLAGGFVSHNSTYWEGRFYWKTSTQVGKKAYILTHEQAATDNLFNITKRYHDNCPEQIKPATKHHSAKALTFEDIDSEFSVATAGTKDTGRSGTGQFFHGSEVAFWANAADHLAGIGQTIADATGTEIALESTGNGLGNMFHGMWVDAVRGASDYLPVFIPWFWQLEYTLEPPGGWKPDAEGIEYMELYGITLGQAYWRDRKIANDFRGETSLFDQEYPATAELAFRRQALDTLLKIAVVEKAMRRTDIEGVGPRIMGIDPSESEVEAADDTVFCLRQGRKVEHFRRFHGKKTMETVALAARAIMEWKPDFINVDAGGLGSGIADRLIELGYPVSRILFGERAIEVDLYGLRRDEMWGEMAEWFKGEVQLPYDMAALSDLCAPAKDEDASLRFKLETKKHMKGRGLKSPDAGDALALTFAIPVTSTTPKRPNRSIDRPNWRVM